MIIHLKNKHTLQVDDFILNVLLEKMVFPKEKKKVTKKHQKVLTVLNIFTIEKIS